MIRAGTYLFIPVSHLSIEFPETELGQQNKKKQRHKKKEKKQILETSIRKINAKIILEKKFKKK